MFSTAGMTENTRKREIKMRFALLASAAFLFLSFPAHADIVIGLAGPMTGPNAAIGEQVKRGAERAVADINAQGGVKGEKLVLHQEDDACDPKQAVTAANKLVSGG